LIMINRWPELSEHHMNSIVDTEAIKVGTTRLPSNKPGAT
jgi:hypothetical protein